MLSAAGALLDQDAPGSTQGYKENKWEMPGRKLQKAAPGLWACFSLKLSSSNKMHLLAYS